MAHDKDHFQYHRPPLDVLDVLVTKYCSDEGVSRAEARHQLSEYYRNAAARDLERHGFSDLERRLRTLDERFDSMRERLESVDCSRSLWTAVRRIEEYAEVERGESRIVVVPHMKGAIDAEPIAQFRSRQNVRYSVYAVSRSDISQTTDQDKMHDRFSGLHIASRWVQRRLKEEDRVGVGPLMTPEMWSALYESAVRQTELDLALLDIRRQALREAERDDLRFGPATTHIDSTAAGQSSTEDRTQSAWYDHVSEDERRAHFAAAVSDMLYSAQATTLPNAWLQLTREAKAGDHDVPFSSSDALRSYMKRNGATVNSAKSRGRKAFELAFRQEHFR